jgi:hypothetical protein
MGRRREEEKVVIVVMVVGFALWGWESFNGCNGSSGCNCCLGVRLKNPEGVTCL